MNPITPPSSSPLASSSTSGGSSSSWFSGFVRGRKSNSQTMANKSALAGGVGNGGPDTLGPINRKNQFRGVMFKYGSKPAQVAFKTGDYKQQVVFIGGLTDGFLATKYLEPLAIALDKEKWSLVQCLLSSSYSGYGISSLKELSMLGTEHRRSLQERTFGSFLLPARICAHTNLQRWYLFASIWA